MIKTKLAFAVFLFLSLIIFPFYLLLYFSSDFFSSITPGWNTNIYPGEMMGDLMKFMILSVSVHYYWKLSKILNSINLKKFIIHFVLTIPAVVASKISYHEFFNALSPEKIIRTTHLIVYSITFINVLFFIGQLLFWKFYNQSKK